MQHSRIDEIDGLRAVAMTAVIAQHCKLAPFGWTGVWLFFVISGYVISRNFLQREYAAADWGKEYRNFMLRRFFRIVPVYMLYISIGAAVLLLINKPGALRDLPFLITFTYNWQMIFNAWPGPETWPAFGHLWTLSIEEQFYVVFPLLFLLLPRHLYVPALIALIVAGPPLRLVYTLSLAGVSDDSGWLAFAVYAASFAHFDAFLIGAAIARFEPRIRADRRIPVVLGACAALAAMVYATTYWHVNRAAGASGIEALRNIFSGILYGSGREVWAYSVVNLLAAVALVLAILQKPVTRPLSWWPVALVGRISYGGYLYHALILWVALALLPWDMAAGSISQRVVLLAGVWTLTVAAAYASYRWFETPIIAWARGLGEACPPAHPQAAPRGSASRLPALSPHSPVG
jgi:peptidoglycan/LPS O-acetylase OafA/YrhL